MFEFGVWYMGVLYWSGTVQADVTPPCLEGGGEDGPGYIRVSRRRGRRRKVRRMRRSGGHRQPEGSA